MMWPWVSARRFRDLQERYVNEARQRDITEARLSDLAQRLSAFQKRYDDVVSKMTAQMLGMVKEGFRPAANPPAALDKPWTPPPQVADAILAIAGPGESALRSLLQRYAYTNRTRPPAEVAKEIHDGGA